MKTVKITQELSSKEIKMLRYRLLAVFVFFLFAAGLFGFIYLQGGFKSIPGFFIIFPLFFFGIVFYMASGFVRDLFRGEKLVIRGIVTDKRRHKTQSGGRKKKSSSRPSYYLYFNDDKYYVDAKHYSQAMVGQEIELHYAPCSNTALGIIPLTGVQEEGEHANSTSALDKWKEKRELAENLPRRDLSMSQSELSVLKKERNRLLRMNISFAIFMGMMGLVFGLASILWWVMLIPTAILALVVFGFVRGAMKTWRKFRQDESGQVKTVILTKVLDKQHHTGSHRGHTIATEFGSYNVSKSQYESLNGQDAVFLMIGKHSGWLIEILGRNEQDGIQEAKAL